MRTVDVGPTFEAWQAVARTLLHEGVSPAEVTWRHAPAGTGVAAVATQAVAGPRVPRQFLELARQAAGTSDPERWALLYEILWRLVHERRDLLADSSDPHVRRLNTLAAPLRLESPSAAPAEAPGAGVFIPPNATLDELRAASARCQGCDLFRHATQTVFGIGPATARIVLVGEQPGDQEDRKGAPFVGPAGEVLDRALIEVGLDRQHVYVTNAVKHFKFTERGKRRIHETPRAPEITACRPWLEAELEVIRPAVLGVLGATAARVIIGPEFRLLRQHGQLFSTRWSPKTIATIHPSAVLRGEGDAEQARLYAMLCDDLRLMIAA
jgi:uracil-DNA glycosylase